MLIQGQNDYIELAEMFLYYLQSQSFNVTVINSVTERDAEVLIDSLCRIFVIFGNQQLYPWISCVFHYVGLNSEYYQTIFVGDFEEVKLIYSYFDIFCPVNLNESAQSAIAVHFSHDIQSYRDTVLITDELIRKSRKFIKRLDQKLIHYKVSDLTHAVSQESYAIAAAAYDATWAIALALNASIEHLAENNWTLKDYLPISNPDVSAVILNQFENLSFQGVQKLITFEEQRHFPHEDVIISQFQGYNFIPVAVYDTKREVMIDKENTSFMWIGQGPPSDRPIVVNFNIDTKIVWTMLAVSVLGLVFSFSSFIFNCHFRNKRLIKASSPNINNIIILGCSILFLSVTSNTFQGHHIIPEEARIFFCNITIWMVFSGFTLSFGALTIKTWRVYRVFKNPWSKHRVYKDSFLCSIIAGMVAFDWIILILFSILSPLQPTEVMIETKDYIYLVLICENQEKRAFSTVFTYTLIIYNVLMLFFGTFLAVQTRTIKSQAFNDSRFISMTIYMVAITTLIGLPVAIFIVIAEKYILAFLCVNITLALLGFIILLTVFLPKAMALIKTRKK